MPYIEQKDRPPFVPAINQIVKLMHEDVGDDDPLIRCGEQVGYFIFDLVKKFLESKFIYVAIKNPYEVVFNNRIGGDNEYLIEKQVDAIIVQLLRDDDLLRQGAEINYVCSSVCWRAIGEDGKYALRAFIKGCIWGVINMMKELVPHWENDREYHMLYGVLTDVIDEMYRRRTAIYEDKKIAQNGDIIWT